MDLVNFPGGGAVQDFAWNLVSRCDELDVFETLLDQIQQRIVLPIGLDSKLGDQRIGEDRGVLLSQTHMQEDLVIHL